MRPISSNPFVGLPAATLTALQGDFINAVTAVAVAGQSYTINGRQFTRAELDVLKDTLAEINAAIDAASGRGVTVAHPIF